MTQRGPAEEAGFCMRGQTIDILYTLDSASIYSARYRAHYIPLAPDIELTIYHLIFDSETRKSFYPVTFKRL